jgi:hypothetical protein
VGWEGGGYHLLGDLWDIVLLGLFRIRAGVQVHTVLDGVGCGHGWMLWG